MKLSISNKQIEIIFRCAGKIWCRFR